MQKHVINWIIAATLSVMFCTALAEEETPSATLMIDETQVMALIGGSMGGGTLLLDDDSHSFKVIGLKLGGVGVHSIHVTGEVYHLEKLKDFPGTYLALEAGATLGTGSGGLWLKNTKGVTLHLRSTGEGLALNLGAEGLKITLNQGQ